MKIATIEKCKAVTGRYWDPKRWEEERSFSSYRRSKTTAATLAMGELEAARAKDVAVHETNLPGIETNKAIRQQVETLMAEIGMPKTYQERDSRSRSMYAKYKTLDAGYLGDLRRNVITDDGFDAATASYENNKQQILKYQQAADQEAKQAQAAKEREREKAKEERRANIELATIILRYGLDVDSDWPDVLEALCAKDQRLDLAVAGYQTRCGWSEGYYRVQAAFDRFHIETDEDKEIAGDIASCLASEGDSDGRVFRDTTWSYDRLFASVSDQQLVTDAKLALERSER